MKWIKQEKFGQCGAACLAMVLDLDLDDLVAELEDLYGPLEHHGLNDDEMVECLHRHGLGSARVVMERNSLQPAILTVPSLNHRGFLHYIVWDGQYYIDPSRGTFLYPRDAPKIGGETKVFWTTAIVWDEEAQ